MLPAACLSKYAILLDFFIEASKSTFEWLIITDIYLSHSHNTPLLKPLATIIAFMETVCQGKSEIPDSLRGDGAPARNRFFLQKGFYCVML